MSHWCQVLLHWAQEHFRKERARDAERYEYPRSMWGRLKVKRPATVETMEPRLLLTGASADGQDDFWYRVLPDELETAAVYAPASNPEGAALDRPGSDEGREAVDRLLDEQLVEDRGGPQVLNDWQPAVDYDDLPVREFGDRGEGALFFRLNRPGFTKNGAVLFERGVFGQDEAKLRASYSKLRSRQKTVEFTLETTDGRSIALGGLLINGQNAKAAEPTLALVWSAESVRLYANGELVRETKAAASFLGETKSRLAGRVVPHAPVERDKVGDLTGVRFVGSDLRDAAVRAMTQRFDNEDRRASLLQGAVAPVAAFSVTTNGNGATLSEAADFISEYRYDVTVQIGATALGIKYSALSFDTTATGEVKDAFELALLDSNGEPVGSTIGEGRDAFFNRTEGQAALLASGVGHDAAAGTVGIDVTGRDGETLTVVARLINNDSDNNTTVTIEQGSATPQHTVLWGVDEDDGHLFAVWDLTDPISTFIDYGVIQVDDGAGGLIAVDQRIESLAVDTSGTAYMVANTTVDGTAAPVLLRVDTNALVDPAAGVVAEVVGRVPVTLMNPDDMITGLSFSPTGDLYATFHDGSLGAPDRLLKIDIDETGAAPVLSVAQNFPLVQQVGAPVDTPQLNLVEDIAFKDDGTLWVVSNDSEEENEGLYEVDPSTGRLMAGSLTSISGVEGLSYDPAASAFMFSWVWPTDNAFYRYGGLPLETVMRPSVFGISDPEAIDLHVTSTPMPDRTALFALDEDDAQLGAFWNVGLGGEGKATDLGFVQMADPTNTSAYYTVTAPEALEIDSNGVAWFVHTGNILNSGIPEGPKLLKIDLKSLGSSGFFQGGPIEATFVGEINVDASTEGSLVHAYDPMDPHITVPDLAIHPTTGELYGIWAHYDKDAPTQSADELIKIDMADGSISKVVGSMSGASDYVKWGQGLAFNANGTELYVADLNESGSGATPEDDRVFVVDPSNAAVLSVRDATPFSGLSSPPLANNERLLSLEWEPGAGELHASEPDTESVLNITAQDGGNNVVVDMNVAGVTESEGIAYYPQIKPTGSGSSGGGEITPPALDPDGENTPLVDARASLVPASLDFDALSDVTGAFTVDYAHTSYDKAEDRLFAGVTIQKTGAQQVRGKLLLAVTNINEAGVQWEGFDGRTQTIDGVVDAGTPYLDVTHLLATDPNGFFDLDALTAEITLRFQHASVPAADADGESGGARFGYDLVLLGQLNQAPVFDTDPVDEVRAGNTYRYAAMATDPDGDDVIYRLGAGAPSGLSINQATGELTWNTTAGDTGSYVFSVIADDQLGGVTEQLVELKVFDSIPNRPPQFQTDPVTVAYSGVPYVYDSDAIDPDGDDLTYSGEVFANDLPEALDADAAVFYRLSDLSGSVVPDTSSHGRDASVVGGTVSDQNLGAVYFDGTGDGIQLDDADDPGVEDDWVHAGFTQRSVSLWFKPDGGITDSQMLFEEGGITAGMAIRLHDGKLKYRVNENNTGYVANHTLPTDPAWQESWHHVLAVYNAGDMTLYLDGQQVASNTAGPASIPAHGDAAGLGATAGNGNVFQTAADDRYTGWMRSVAIFDAALTQSDLNGLLAHQQPEATINPTDGSVSFTASSALIGQTIHVDLLADDGQGGIDTQGYDVLVLEGEPYTPGLPDLAAENVDVSGLTYDPQRLTVQGLVSVDVTNLGEGSVNDPFSVLFFEDLDLDQAYTPGVDQALQTIVVDQALASGLSTTALVAIDSSASFAGAPIWAWVDSGQVITESDETNNLAGSQEHCRLMPVVGGFDAVFRKIGPDSRDGVLMTPVVADINHDGIPEVIYTDWYTHRLIAVDGATGVDLFAGELVGGINESTDIAVGDLDNDGHWEIVATTVGGQIRLFEYIDGFLYSTPPVSFNKAFPMISPAISLANLDNDSESEILIGNVVFEHDLSVKPQLDLPVGWNSYASQWLGPISIAADLDGDEQLEIVLGNAAIEVDGTPLWLNETSFGEYDSLGSGFNGVADFDGDGLPEVVLVSKGRVSLLGGQAGQLIWSTEFSEYGTPLWEADFGGAPTIADVDGDGVLDIGVASALRYVVFDGVTGALKWSYATQDTTSAVTGSSVFDFDGDGRSEILYGDEKYIRFFQAPSDINSPDLEVMFQYPRASGTANELPVVADVDADGNAEVVIVVSQKNVFGGALDDGVYIIEDANDTWVPTRNLWNQHSYHITNINDDGTIPLVEERSWLASNTFRLNTNPDLDSLSAPDLIPSYVRVAEDSGQTSYRARVGNAGSFFVGAGVEVAFYDGDPTGAGVLLGVVETTSILEPGQYEDVELTVFGPAIDDLWIVLDPSDEVRECNENNNAYNPQLGVAPTPNIRPMLGAIADVTHPVATEFALALAGNDLNNDRLRYELIDGPGGMTLNQLSGDLAWTPGLDQVGTHRVQVGVDDGRGGRATQRFVLTVEPSADPQLTLPVGASVALGSIYTGMAAATDADGVDADNLVFKKLFGPDGLSVASDGAITWDTVGETAGVYDVVMEVSDGRGGSHRETFELRVTKSNTSAPVIQNATAGVLQVRETIGAGLKYVAQVNAYDPDGDALDYMLSGEPVGMQINNDSGLITWDTTLDDMVFGPSYTGISVTVSDGTNQTIATFDVEVTPSLENAAPTMISTPSPSVIAGEVYTHQAAATDPDGDPIAWALVDGPDGAVIDAETGLLTWPTANEQIGSHTLVIQVIDPYGAGQVVEFPVEVRATNLPPRMGFSVPTQAYAGQTDYTFDVTVVDPEGGPVTLSASLGDSQGASASWLDSVVDNGDGTWTVSSSLVGAVDDYTIVLTATDSEGRSDVQSIPLQVVSSAVNEPPNLVDIDRTPGPDPFTSAKPTISGLPVAVGELYTYTVQVADPNGDTLSFSLHGDSTVPEDAVNVTNPDQGKASLEATGNTLTVRWRPSSAQVGNQLIKIAVQDSNFTLTLPLASVVRTNAGPTLQALGSVNAPVGGTMREQAFANDPDYDQLFYSLADGTDTVPAGMSINELGLITWSPTVADLDNGSPKTYSVNVVVTDSFGATDTQPLTVDVAEDTTAPSVVVQTNNSGPLDGDVIVLTVLASDAAGVASRWIEIDGVVHQLDANGQTQHTVSGTSPILVTGYAQDVNGNEGVSSSLAITPYNETDQAPTISITTPGPDATIDQYTEITGVIDDADFAGAGDQVQYRAQLVHALTGATIILGSKSINAVQSGEIGIAIDPTVLENGSYLLQVEASNAPDLDNPGNFPVRRVETWIEVDSEVAKVGNFGLSFTDLSTSTGGIPIAVTRSYDTLDAQTQGDFGYGWELGITTGSLEVSNLGEDVYFGDDPFLAGNFDTPYRFGTRLDFTLPGGLRMGFTAVPTEYGDGGLADGVLGLGEIFALAFLPDPGNQGVKLEFTGGRDLELGNAEADAFGLERGTRVKTTPVYTDGAALRTVDRLPFSPVTVGWDFLLTTRDGTQYAFDSKGGRLLKVVDAQGNTLDFSQNNDGEVITSTNRASQTVGQVQVIRDSQNRVTEIVDLEDQASGSIQYSYDANGNLETFTDRTGRVATYKYNLDDNDQVIAGLPDHYLTQIIDNAGTKVLQAEFYPDTEPDEALRGRLKGLKDASGNSAPFGYTLDGAGFGLPGGHTVENIADTDGNETEIVRDPAGNVVVRAQEVDSGDYLITTYRYDSDDRQTHVSETYTHTGPVANRFSDALAVISDSTDPGFNAADWASITEFDPTGNPLTTTDALGNVTQFGSYDDFGNPGVIIDPLGNVTRNAYDAETGRLTQTTDAEGNVTKYDYDASGNLDKLTQVETLADGSTREIVTSEFEYDTKGRLTESTSVDPDGASGSQAGVTRYFAYDDAGNQTHSWSVWSDPASVLGDKTLASVTEYDAEGRVTASSQYTLDGAHTNISTLQPAIDTATPDSTSSTAYDAVGRIAFTTDRYGHKSYTLYNSRGLTVETRTQAIDASGSDVWVVSRTAYDANGRGIATVDPFVVTNAEAPYTTDANGMAIANAAFSLASDTFVTSAADLRFSQTDYDALGRVPQSHRLKDATLSLAVDGNHYTTSYDPAGSTALSTTRTFFDAQGRTDYTIDALGNRTDYYYDAAGRTVATLGPAFTDAQGREVRTLTQTVYDAAGRQDSSTSGVAILNTITNFTTKPTLTDLQNDQAAYYDDSIAQTTEFTYDNVGRVTHTIGRGDAVASGGTGDVVTQTIYDSLGRRVAEIDALNRRTDYDYDDAGRLIGVTLPQIDPDGFATGTVDNTRPVYTYGYDAYGNQTTITDPIGNTTTADPDDRVTQFAYDERGRQISRTLPLGVETPGILDDFVETMQYIDGGVHDGMLLLHTDFQGNTTRYSYDDFGRVLTKTYNGGDRTVSYTYDALGRMISMADSGHGTTRNTYDAEGRLTQAASPEGILNHAYDDLGRKTRTWSSKTASGGGATDAITDTRYTYDTLGRLETVAVVERFDAAITAGSEELTTYAYDALGRLAKQTQETAGSSSGLVTTYTYDKLGRVKQIKHDTLAADNNNTAQFDYTYDLAGNRLTATEQFDASRNGALNNTQTFAWTYDGLNRLTQEAFNQQSNGTQTLYDYIDRFAYDLASNRTQVQRDTQNADPSAFTADETTTYSYDNNDRLTEEVADKVGTANDTNTVYAYDPSGGTQQTGKTVREGLTIDSGTVEESHTFTYDERGRMATAVVSKDGTTVNTSYEYNDAGIRVSQTVDGVTTVYHVDMSGGFTGYAQVFEEGIDDNANGQLEAGEVDKTYTLGLDVLNEATPGQLLTFLYDAHGSTRALLDTVGVVVLNGADKQLFTYTAYGLLTAGAGNSGAIPNSLTTHLYSGEQTDAATGLQYLRARYYDPASGRFNRLDPFAGNQNDPLSLHKYLYTHGNPVMGIDPTGLFTVTELLTSATTNVVNFLNLAHKVIKAKNLAETVIGVIQVLHGLSKGGVGSAINEIYRQFKDELSPTGTQSRVLAQLTLDDLFEVAQKITADIPEIAVAIASVHSHRRKLAEVLKERNRPASKLRFVYFAPTLGGYYTGEKRTIRLPGVNTAGLKSVLSVGTRGGRLIGFGFKSKNSLKGYQLLRIDWHQTEEDHNPPFTKYWQISSGVRLHWQVPETGSDAQTDFEKA